MKNLRYYKITKSHINQYFITNICHFSVERKLNLNLAPVFIQSQQFYTIEIKLS